MSLQPEHPAAVPNLWSSAPGPRLGLWIGLGLGSAGIGLIAAGLALLWTGPAGALVAFGLCLFPAAACFGIALDRLQHLAGVSMRAVESAWQIAESRLARHLEQIEKLAAAPPAESAQIDPSIFAIEQALASGDWRQAGALLQALELARPDDPIIVILRTRHEQARDSSLTSLASELEAARSVGDVARVLELHGLLAPALDLEKRNSLDRDLAKWFLERIQKRLLSGKIQLEIVQLATQVAETFSSTIAGASLKQSLPMLRRSVGLCSRCAQPYTGTNAACPTCMPSSGPAATSPEPLANHKPPDQPNNN